MYFFVMTEEQTTMKLYVYGTLKRDGCAAYLLTEAHFLGEVATAPHYRLYSAGWFPVMVESEDYGQSIQGELWEISETLLPRLDHYEGSGYVRAPVKLAKPFSQITATTYLYKGSVGGLAEIDRKWDNNL
jgi:gamma-glutamylcyclotransferase (GGCT)/AIG2-like uncharacterized protein YtfP